MLIEIPNLFSPQEAQAIRQQLEQSDWVDGKVTAGYQSGKVKNNRQLPEDHPLGRELGNRIIKRLTARNVFIAAALPQEILPPLFNLYEGGESFGFHIDKAHKHIRGHNTETRIVREKSVSKVR